MKTDISIEPVYRVVIVVTENKSIYLYWVQVYWGWLTAGQIEMSRREEEEELETISHVDPGTWTTLVTIILIDSVTAQVSWCHNHELEEEAMKTDFMHSSTWVSLQCSMFWISVDTSTN